MKIEKLKDLLSKVSMIDLQLKNINKMAVDAASFDDCSIDLMIDVVNHKKIALERAKIEAKKMAKGEDESPIEGLKNMLMQQFEQENAPMKNAVNGLDISITPNMLLKISDIIKNDLIAEKNILVARLKRSKISF